jgi:hypothetical protein
MLSGMADAESPLCRLRAAQEGGFRSPATGTMVFVRALGPGSFANKTDGPKCLSLPHRIYLARAA